MKACVLILFVAASLHAEPQITWQRQQLHGDFYSEGAGIGDINGDGKPDVVAGPFWWEGPTFEKKHAYYEPKIFSINGYSDNFFAYVHDFDADKRNDILILGFPGKEARLYLNPGTHDDKPWPMHIVADVVDNESPVFSDITGDGKPEIVCSTGGKFGWFAPNWDKPTEKWPFVAISDDMKVAKFTHGLGVGDVNGDGKMDLLEARRWWENTGTPNFDAGDRISGSKPWPQHNFAAGVGGGAQMFAYDFDGNGTNDVFTALAAHRYGVAVYLQTGRAGVSPAVSGVPPGTSPGSASGETPTAAGKMPALPTWTRVMLASEQPQDNDYGIVFSQPHAAHLADINGDGIKDIVTGKRYWAHNGHDPDERGARVIYWYETKRDGKGGVDFVPHLVDAESGVGVDVQVGDVNGDKLPDIVVANKAGVYILTQKVVESRRDSSADTSRGATGLLSPVKMYGPALRPQTEYAHGQSAQDALKSMQLPTGFKADLIVAEPDLVQPIAFTFDERGRIWVIEGNSYPQPRAVGAGQDRILILEDSNGDGTFETRKVFCEGLNLCSGIELGFGGVWVGAAPYLMFIPRDGDRPVAGDGRSKMADGAKQNPSSISQLPSPAGLPETIANMPRVPGLPFVAYALLDGWGSQDTHETLNSFIWGPDGWLYGCHGVFTHSRVGKPGTPDDQRLPINAGVWRYHPVRHTFEIFAEGTSNPWGLDYDQHGEFFVTACVIPHLYHIVPGGRYQRQAGQHFNPYTYDDIKTIADHLHYAGSQRPDVAHDKTTGAGIVNDDTNALGGGHAHCGLAIYQSNQFPPTYRNKLIFGNLHGHRLVTNYTDPKGSTYVGKHGSDFMRANDMNFIPVTQKVGPDGALYVSDWADKQICHRGSGAVELWDRSNGRIYKVSYVGFVSPGRAGILPAAGGVSPHAERSMVLEQVPGKMPATAGETPALPKAPFDLAKESDETLAKLAVQTENEWFSRMALKMLRERATNKDLLILNNDKTPFTRALERLGEPLHNTRTSRPLELRAMWAYAAGGLPPIISGEFYEEHDNETARAMGIRLMIDDWTASKPTHVFMTGKEYEAYSRNQKPASADISPLDLASVDTDRSPPIFDTTDFADHTSKETSPLVRREIASMLQRMPVKARSEIATALLTHGEDKGDPYIPLLIWYGIEPLVGADAKVGLELAKASKMPKVTEFIYRRLGAEDAGRTGLLTLAAETKDAAQRDALINTVILAARAGNKITMPEGWAAMRKIVASTSVETNGSTQRSTPDSTKVEATLTELEAFMGVSEAKQAFRTQLTNPALARDQREAALTLLMNVRDTETAPLLIQLIKADDKALTRRAVQALATLAHAETPALLTAKFTKLDAATQQDAINTLATNAAGAKALLTAVKAKTIATSALSPFLARQIAALKNAEVDGLLKETFGDLNAPKPHLEERKKKFRTLLAPAVLAKADKTKGKILFSAVCGSCHQMFGEGQKVGPDLTGSNRANLDYLLDNVLDPNAVIGKDYQLNLFELNDGRVASGVVKEATPAAYRIAMPGGIEQTISVSEVKARTIAKVSTMPEGLFDALPPEALQQLVAYLQSNTSSEVGRSVPERRGSLGTASPTRVEGALEGETLKVIKVEGGTTKVQGMGGFGNRWSNGAQLWWTGAKPGSTLTIAVPVTNAGKYALSAVLTKAKDYGMISVALDGQPVVTDLDGFNADKVILTDELDWGTHDFKAGEHKLTFTITGANPSAVKSHMVGLDYVKLEKK